MPNTLIILMAVLGLAGVLYFEKKENRYDGETENRGNVLPVKTALSSLFIVAVAVQPHPLPAYYHLVLAGLLFCMGGDVCLALPHKKAFLLGLVSFLVGHVFYAIAFFTVARPGPWTWVGTAIVLAFGILVFLRFRPHLGPMLAPVCAYIIVISVMVVGACTVLADPRLACSGRGMVFAGALLFYFSDLFVARHRFVRKAFFNRLIGLPLYYAGQFILAFSVGLLV